MKRLAWWLLVVVLALAGGLGLCGLVAALGAAWGGNILSLDGTRSRLLAIVGVSEGTAFVLSVPVLLLAVAGFFGGADSQAGRAILLVLVLLLIVVALVAARRLRSTSESFAHVCTRWNSSHCFAGARGARCGRHGVHGVAVWAGGGVNAYTVRPIRSGNRPFFGICPVDPPLSNLYIG